MQGSTDLTPTTEEQITSMTDHQKELVNVFKKLTVKQRSFVEARLSGMTPFASARAAGYSDPEGNAYKIESNPLVKTAFTLANKNVIEDMQLDRYKVLQGFMDATQMADSATELVAAWREIGKVLGVYEPQKIQVEHSLEEMTREQLGRMSDKELIELSGQSSSEDEPIDAEFELISEAISDPIPVEGYDKTSMP